MNTTPESVSFLGALRSRQMFHTTYKLYMASLTLEIFHLFIMVLAYGNYATDGRDNYGLRTFGRIFESLSILVFLLMLILMGKGFTITRGRLSTGGSVKIAIFMTLFVITYAVLFIYEAQVLLHSLIVLEKFPQTLSFKRLIPLYCFCAGSIFSDMYCLLRT
jgi:hypothetical protein